MQCPNCEAENRDDALFCDECGFPLDSAHLPSGKPASETKSRDRGRIHVDAAGGEYGDYGNYGDSYGDAQGGSYANPYQYPYDDAYANSYTGAYDDAYGDSRGRAYDDIDDGPLRRQDDGAYEPQPDLRYIDASDPFGEPVSDPFTPEPFNLYAEPEHRRDAFDSREHVDARETVGYGEPVSPRRTYSTRETYDARETFNDRELYGARDDYGEREAVGAYDYDMSGSSYPRSSSEPQPVASTESQAGVSDGAEAARPDYTLEMPRVEQEAPRPGRDFMMANTVSNRGRRKRLAIIIAGVAVGVVIALVVTFALGLWGGKPVPEVKGMTEADATRTLNEEGFAVRTTQVKSDDTEGLVLITDPQSGSRAPEGSEVVIHIATTRFIPDIVGKSKQDAEAQLAEAGYNNVRYEAEKSDGDEDMVLSVSPDSGTRAKSNTEIVVKVSEAYRVPSVSDLDATAAMSVMTEAGLNPEVVYVDTDQFVDGTIIGTTPEAGTKVSEGEYVTISVARARGVELVYLTENMLAQGATVTIGSVDYEVESLVSASYQGNETVAFTITGRPKITFFGETLYASSSQTVSGVVVWSANNEVVAIS